MKVDCAIGNGHSRNNELYIYWLANEGIDIGFSEWRCRLFIDI